MSHDATNWAVKQRGLRPIAKIVLWHLADCHNPTMGCFPTQEYLAGEAEVSRASVNRILAELEHAGIIRRAPQIDPKTNKQLPTRYLLAFEKGFEPLHVDGGVTGLDTGPCLKNDDSRVSNSADPVSHSSETLTSKLTSNLTGKASERVSFEDILEAYPCRPMMDRTDARSEYDLLSDPETHRVLTAAKRMHQQHIEDSAARKVDPVTQLGFRPGLGKWLRSGAWVSALTVALKSDPVPPSAEGVVVLPADHPDVKAVERLRGRPVVLGNSGNATLRVEEIEQARTAA